MVMNCIWPFPVTFSIQGSAHPFLEKQIKQKTLHALYKLGLYDSEATIILRGIICRDDFSQVLIMVTNTGSEDFALADLRRLTFTVEIFHSIPMRGSSRGGKVPATVATVATVATLYI
jgi:hypothetical protein